MLLPSLWLLRAACGVASLAQPCVLLLVPACKTHDLGYTHYRMRLAFSGAVRITAGWPQGQVRLATAGFGRIRQKENDVDERWY